MNKCDFFSISLIEISHITLLILFLRCLSYFSQVWQINKMMTKCWNSLFCLFYRYYYTKHFLNLLSQVLLYFSSGVLYFNPPKYINVTNPINKWGGICCYYLLFFFVLIVCWPGNFFRLFFFTTFPFYLLLSNPLSIRSSHVFLSSSSFLLFVLKLPS